MKKYLTTLALFLGLLAISACEARLRESRIGASQHCVEQCDAVSMELVEIRFRDTTNESGVTCICR